MAKYFFTIAYAGLDKNGNSRYRVTGMRKSGKSIMYVTLNKIFMQDIIGGRWSDKTESVTTQQSLQQIKEKLDKHLTNDYNYVLLNGV